MSVYEMYVCTMTRTITAWIPRTTRHFASLSQEPKNLQLL